MSLLVDGLQPYISQQILLLSEAPTHGVAEAILTDAYSLSVDVSKNSLELDFRDPIKSVKPLAFDASRLSNACLQTLLAIESDGGGPNCLAWRLIKIYYASFYAGHALLRFYGESCTHLGSTQITKLSKFLTALGLTAPFPLSSGLYNCTVSGSMLSISPILTGINGGSHEVFWRQFGHEIRSISAKTLLGPLVSTDALAVFQRLDWLCGVLRKQSSADVWLSIVRNNIQYKHGFDLWFPRKLLKKEQEKIAAIVRNWVIDPMDLDISSSRGDIADFTAACVFIVAACREVIIRICERCPKGRSFLQQGPMKLLYQAKKLVAKD